MAELLLLHLSLKELGLYELLSFVDPKFAIIAHGRLVPIKNSYDIFILGFRDHNKKWQRPILVVQTSLGKKGSCLGDH